MVTRANRCNLSQAKLIQYASPHPLTSIVVFFFNLHRTRVGSPYVSLTYLHDAFRNFPMRVICQSLFTGCRPICLNLFAAGKCRNYVVLNYNILINLPNFLLFRYNDSSWHPVLGYRQYNRLNVRTPFDVDSRHWLQSCMYRSLQNDCQSSLIL